MIHHSSFKLDTFWSLIPTIIAMDVIVYVYRFWITRIYIDALQS